MTGDYPEDTQKASPLGVPQGSFEERLRVASEQRAKALAAKAEAKAAEGNESMHTTEIIPIHARKYIRSAPRSHNGTADAPYNASSVADGSVGYPETDPDLTPDSAHSSHVSSDARMSNTSREPRTIRLWAHRLLLVIAFLLGAAAGCIGALLWSRVIVVPALL